MQQPLLTIAIPTFNRAPKLKRLLSIIREEIAAALLQAKVCVLVSDNAPTDQTAAVASEFMGTDFSFTYCCQPQNRGGERNVRFLYTHANTPYVWFMSDDDFPLKGAIAKVVNALETYDPDVLLFSFIQPPGSTFKQFDYPEPVWLVTDPVSAIEHVLRYPKVSIFVVRKVNFDDYQWRVLDENLGDGWYFLSLAFSILEASPNVKLALISEQLATCDEDYNLFGVPWVFLRMHKMAQHPFVMKYHPSLPKFYHDHGYYVAIQFAFAEKVGSLLPIYPKGLDKFIKELEFRGRTLLRRPRSLLQFIALKLRIAGVWPKIKRWMKPLIVYRADR